MAKIDKDKLDKFRKGELKFSQLFDLNANQVASLLLCGHNFLSQGHWEDAKNIFEGVALLDPKNPYVHTMLGAIYQKMAKFDLAILRYTRAIELFPDDINALTNRGEIYLNLGRFTEAANDLKAAIALDPDKKVPLANRARLLAVMTAESLRLAKEKGVQAALSSPNSKSSR